MCKNEYINLILSELREKICVKCKLMERHFNNVFQFALPYPKKLKMQHDNDISASLDETSNDDFCIGDIYKLIELNKLRFNIADYSLSQNTLDNVFINFVKEQTSKKVKPRQRDDNQELDEEEGEDEEKNAKEDDDNLLEDINLNASNVNIQFPIHDTTSFPVDSSNLMGDVSSSSSSLANTTRSNSILSRFSISKNNNDGLFSDRNPTNNGNNNFSNEDHVSS